MTAPAPPDYGYRVVASVMHIAMHGGQAARRLAGALVDIVLPARCVACMARVEQNGRLCLDCWRKVDFIVPPYCAQCGLPFAYEISADARCGACLRAPPDYDQARAVMRYGELSRRLIVAFKHADRTDAAPGFAAWLARAGQPLLQAADVIAPVPLHRWRLLLRHYNQAALLAQNLSRLGGKPAVVDLLRRQRATPSQGGLSASARRRNVRGAFAVRPAYAPLIAGRSVLLVDDVLTTGATAGACATALKLAGARRVEVLTLARVVRETADTI